MSNSYYLREANIYTLEPYDFYQSPNEFVLGFNIRRAGGLSVKHGVVLVLLLMRDSGFL